MSLYGENSVRLDALKKWSKELNEDKIIGKLSKANSSNVFTNETLSLLRCQLQDFMAAIENLKEGDDWRATQKYLSSQLVPAIFMVADNAIRVGNYYECLVTYADVSTKKKLIKGFQYKDIGELNIYEKAGNVIGQIGLKSDLIWSCLYDLFIYDDLYSAEHTLPDHEEILSIQLNNILDKNDDEIRQMIDEIIFKCSKEFELNFQYYHFDPMIREVGVRGHYDLKTSLGEYDNIPIMYFNNALSANDVRIKYLSYYQVMEFYFNRAQNIKILDDIISGGFTTTTFIDHTKLKSILKNYVNVTKELESLKLVLFKAINIEDFKTWINSDYDRIQIYTNSGDTKIDIDLTKSDDRILSKLANRIYMYRCSIAHAKGDAEEYIALPEVSNITLINELPLVRYIAMQTIIYCSNWKIYHI